MCNADVEDGAMEEHQNTEHGGGTSGGAEGGSSNQATP